MAEALVVFGIAANIVQLVDFGSRILHRLNEFQSNVGDVPESFRHIKAELPVLLDALQRTKEAIEAGSVRDETKNALCPTINGCLEQIKSLDEVLLKALPTSGDSWIKRSGKAILSLRYDSKVEKITAIVKKYIQTLTFYHAAGIETIKQAELLKGLPSAKYAAFNSYKQNDPRPECLEGTRVELLRQIQDWGEDRSGKYIFWLSGMAGTGKSTIAHTVAHRFSERGLLGASFFFSRGREDLRSAAKLFTTIAVQLAEALPGLKAHVCNAITKHGDIGEQALRDQWRRLILEPLRMLEENLPPLSSLVPSSSPVVVIDALDECEGDRDIQEILGLLIEAKDLSMVRIRVFITSRPEIPINLGFNNMSQIVHHDEILHSIPRSLIEHDISIFLRHELATIREKRKIGGDWPDEEDIQKLIQRADRLFIYAATACRFLYNSPFPKKRLSEMLKVKSTGHPSTKELDEMYKLVLRQSIARGSDEDTEDLVMLFKQIVGSIIILSDTLSAAALAELLKLSFSQKEDMQEMLKHLGSVLNVPDDETSPLQLFHLSFRDFLLNKTRCQDPLLDKGGCTDPQLWVNEEATHSDLFARCLDLMKGHLRKDMCDLQRPGVLASELEYNKIESCLPPAVQYACCYWVAHLQGAKIGLYDGDVVHKFLQKHFLHWLEALSLMQKTSEGVLAITSLESIIIVSEANGG